MKLGGYIGVNAYRFFLPSNLHHSDSSRHWNPSGADLTGRTRKTAWKLHVPLSEPLKEVLGNFKNSFSDLCCNHVSTSRHFGHRRPHFPLPQTQKCTLVSIASSWPQRMASDWQPPRYANEFRMGNLSQMVQGAWYVLLHVFRLQLISEHREH